MKIYTLEEKLNRKEMAPEVSELTPHVYIPDKCSTI
jgi:hypothetical protein